MAITALFAAALLSAPQKASPRLPQKPAARPRIQVPYEKYTLPNGLKVILHVDKSLPLATINTWFRVGSKDEAARRSGFAHLYEHLMFMGTERVPSGEFDQIMEKLGGSNNASTTEDRTNYFSYGPSSLLPTLLWLDADRLEALDEAMDQRKLDLQREVVKNERRQNVEEEPYGKAYEALNSLLYPVGHPYSTSVIGSHEDLTAATVDDVKSFFRTYYVPNNASLVVAGDFDPKQIKPVINRLFGTLPRGNDPVRKSVPKFEFRRKSVTMVDDVSLPKTIFAYHTPAKATKDDERLTIAATVLASGIGSRLQKRLIVETGLASEVSASQYSMELGSYFYIDATVAPGARQADMEREIDRVLSDLSKTGPTRAELKKVYAQTEASFAQILQSISRKADVMNEFETYYGEPDSFQRILDSIGATKPAEVREVVSQYLQKSKRLELRVIPKLPVLEKNPRDVRPAPGGMRAWSPPRPAEFEGIRYWQRPNVPEWVVRVNIAHAPVEPVSRLGLTQIAAEWIARGGGKSSSAFQTKLDALGATISPEVSVSGVAFQLSVPASNAAAATALLSEMLASPALERSDFESIKASAVAARQEEKNSIASLAAKAVQSAYFGAHPYGRPLGGTETSVAAITAPEARALAGAILKANRTIYAGGAMSPASAKALLMRSKLARKGPIRALPQVAFEPVRQTRVIVVDKPGAVQSAIRIVVPGTPVASPEALLLEAVQVALGGSFTSRLNQNLREAKGYTYGAGAGLVGFRDLGYLTMSSSVRADVTGASLREFLTEIDRVQAGDFSEDEAQKASKQIATNLVTEFESLGGLIASAASLAEVGLSFDWLESKLSKVGGLRAAELNRIGGKYVKRSGLLIVIAGDREAILAQIASLGLPEPVVVKP